MVSNAAPPGGVDRPDAEQWDGTVVSVWTASSPYGLGADPFAAGMTEGRGAITPLDRTVWSGPYDEAALIPEFRIADVLGARGTRAMDRLTGIVCATVGMLLAECGPELTAQPEGVGLVLGASGSVQSTMDFTRDSLTGAKPYHVDPARFPNVVMNRAAGQSAIWYGLKGPNATMAGGSVTGLVALNYAARLLRFGRSDVILCGAAEEFSSQRAWLAWHARGGGVPGSDAEDRDDATDPLGEGCSMFLLESAAHARQSGRQPLASVLATRFAARSGSGGPRQALTYCVTEALRQAGVRAGDVRLIAASDADGRLGKEEDAALVDVFGTTGESDLELGGAAAPQRLACRRLIGDTSAASAAFQLAAVLAAARVRPDLLGGLALVTSLDRFGATGCTLLRLGPDGQAQR